MRNTQKSIFALFGVATSFICLMGCGNSMKMHKPEQGLYGSFSTYGPPSQIQNCEPMHPQSVMDSCRKENARVIEEPFQGSFQVRNLSTAVLQDVELDAEGKYRINLDQGEYEVCIKEICSDPIEIRMGKFSIYGQRLPRPVVGATPSGAVASPTSSSKARTPSR